MTRSKEELLKLLSDCVLEMEDEDVVDISNEYIKAGYPALEGIMDGLVDGMNKAGVLYDEEEYFVTDLLLCSDAMYAGLEILKPHIPSQDNEGDKIKVVIGVVEGDTHDIGKNLVKIMLDTAGFEMYDLGRDVPLDSFVEKAIEVDAKIICMSTLMTTTMDGMSTVIQKLKDRGIRDDIKIMIGGSPISQKFADEIGADGYSSNAVEAVKLAKRLVGIA
ncbi:corrinoid protein [Peptostreptococcus porci]|uniref:corrinoid protein n=1 Tax=Peptostreptococcus porci TaxID=2652282 RepID=UPI002A7F2B6F|nr:corrinoid protein [Peptostreptococcus porci]MDY4128329.1 corrinoid protein [Peptostreptococcus porci]